LPLAAVIAPTIRNLGLIEIERVAPRLVPLPSSREHAWHIFGANWQHQTTLGASLQRRTNQVLLAEVHQHKQGCARRRCRFQFFPVSGRDLFLLSLTCVGETASAREESTKRERTFRIGADRHDEKI